MIIILNQKLKKKFLPKKKKLLKPRKQVLLTQEKVFNESLKKILLKLFNKKTKNRLMSLSGT